MQLLGNGVAATASRSRRFQLRRYGLEPVVRFRAAKASSQGCRQRRHARFSLPLPGLAFLFVRQLPKWFSLRFTRLRRANFEFSLRDTFVFVLEVCPQANGGSTASATLGSVFFVIFPFDICRIPIIISILTINSIPFSGRCFLTPGSQRSFSLLRKRPALKVPPSPSCGTRTQSPTSLATGYIMELLPKHTHK